MLATRYHTTESVITFNGTLDGHLSDMKPYLQNDVMEMSTFVIAYRLTF